MKVVFVTPGLLDIMSFTVMGLSSKPNSGNPIGKFGTGLKYAVAVLLRSGAKVRLFIGGVEYEFYTTQKTFRGKDFNQIKMRKRNSPLKRWTSQDLPFTTDYGKYWKLWQAFRELESNTRDEGGQTLSTELVYDKRDVPVSALDHITVHNTVIEVESREFWEVWLNRNEVFLPVNAPIPPISDNNGVEVYHGPSKFIYWRGIRVFDLEEPSLFTYNITKEMTLTEDRTLANVYYATQAIADAVILSSCQDWVETVLMAGEKSFEKRISYDYVNYPPSDLFKRLARRLTQKGSSAYGLYSLYAPKVPEKIIDLPIDEELEWQIENCPKDNRRLARFLERLDQNHIIISNEDFAVLEAFKIPDDFVLEPDNCSEGTIIPHKPELVGDWARFINELKNIPCVPEPEFVGNWLIYDKGVYKYAEPV